MIWEMVETWRTMGLDVRVAHGPTDPVAAEGADLVVPHVNLTMTPPEYRDYLDRQPNVVNRGVYDVSKRAISKNLVAEDDSYDGPVIVKTDLNYGGLPELGAEARARRMTLWGRVRARVFGKKPVTRPPFTSLEDATALRVDEYRVFPTRAEVPAGVFRNPHLVVERFVPERKDGLFLLRTFFFFGDRECGQLRGGPDPVVKGPSQTLREPATPHPGIVALRREMGWDYGKFDYVLRHGEVVLLDANRTPGTGRISAISSEIAHHLAGGVGGLLARSGCTLHPSA